MDVICWFVSVCGSDSALLTAKPHSISADCIFAADFGLASDFATSATGQKPPELTVVKSQDDSVQLTMSAEAQACGFIDILCCCYLTYCI